MRTCNAVMKCLVRASQLDRAYKLLRRVHANKQLVPRSYPTHQLLLSACREAGDVDRADAVQAAIDRFGLEKTLAAEATLKVGGVEERLQNGPMLYGRRARGESSGHALDAAVEALYERVLASTAYSPQLHALPCTQAARL